MNQQGNPQTQQQQMSGASMLNTQNQGPVSGMSNTGGLPGQNQINGSDTYSISQSQTINFTQQTLRQRATGGK